ncbi:MAG TPA: NUDIX domain-containing protein [Steroidobacteraceae bacterium]|nr:NUDIX domain-containing protein [Steroidobacteraceae bacterium]
MARRRTLAAKTLGVTTEYQGYLSIRRYEIEEDLHRGGRQRVTRLVMERGHAVAVLAYDPRQDRVVLVNELRAGILAAGGPAFSDALIAGAIEPGETALDAAVREAREEAGLELEAPYIIHERAYVSPGGTSESIAIVYAAVTAPLASEVHGSPTEQENIRTTILSPRKLFNRIAGGEINDMKTLLAGCWLKANRTRLRREAAAARGAPSPSAAP